MLAKQKLAIFVHGCIWHSCPKCMGGRVPKTNRAYWSEKLRRNRERDAENQAALEAMGYLVLVIWECELKGEGLARAVERIADFGLRISD